MFQTDNTTTNPNLPHGQGATLAEVFPELQQAVADILAFAPVYERHLAQLNDEWIKRKVEMLSSLPKPLAWAYGLFNSGFAGLATAHYFSELKQRALSCQKYFVKIGQIVGEINGPGAHGLDRNALLIKQKELSTLKGKLSASSASLFSQMAEAKDKVYLWSGNCPLYRCLCGWANKPLKWFYGLCPAFAKGKSKEYFHAAFDKIEQLLECCKIAEFHQMRCDVGIDNTRWQKFTEAIQVGFDERDPWIIDSGYRIYSAIGGQALFFSRAKGQGLSWAEQIELQKQERQEITEIYQLLRPKLL